MKTRAVAGTRVTISSTIASAVIATEPALPTTPPAAVSSTVMMTVAGWRRLCPGAKRSIATEEPRTEDHETQAGHASGRCRLGQILGDRDQGVRLQDGHALSAGGDDALLVPPAQGPAGRAERRARQLRQVLA